MHASSGCHGAPAQRTPPPPTSHTRLLLVDLSTLGGGSSAWVLINLRPQRDETSNVLTQPPRHETGAQRPETHVAHLMRSRPAPARIRVKQGLEAPGEPKSTCE